MQHGAYSRGMICLCCSQSNAVSRLSQRLNRVRVQTSGCRKWAADVKKDTWQGMALTQIWLNLEEGQHKTRLVISLWKIFPLQKTATLPTIANISKAQPNRISHTPLQTSHTHARENTPARLQNIVTPDHTYSTWNTVTKTTHSGPQTLPNHLQQIR